MSNGILLTGGAGYIGSHTAVELLDRGFNVVIVDNLCNSGPESIKRIECITGKRIKFYRADIGDYHALKNVFSENEIDGVIHFAGLKAVGESVVNPLRYYENNVSGSLTLFKLLEEFGIKKIVFSSSATVYGNPERLPLDEECRLAPANPYGNTKLVIENILKDMAKADSDLCVIILRYFNPVGAHISGLIGENPRGVPNNLAPYIARVAAGALPYVNVYGADYPTPDGTGIRDYIHIKDLILGHISALENIKKPGAYIYNLGTGVGRSVLEVIKAFERILGRSLPYRIARRREGDVASCYADAAKAYADLGWKAKFDLEDMCASLWNFQKKNPNGYNQ